MLRRLSSLLLLAGIFTFPLSNLHSYQLEDKQIEKIEVLVEEGCESTESDLVALRSLIKTHEGDFFSQHEFDADLKRLSLEFDHIEPSLELREDKVYITLKVWKKPTIRSITWRGYSKVERESLQKELGVRSCAIFDRIAFNRAFNKLKTLYVKRGYFEAELDYVITRNPETNEVDIVIEICEGRAGRIKEIIFDGFCPDEEEAICGFILTKTYNFFTSWFTNEGLYNEEMVQQDQSVILNYIQNQGYADAKVELEVKEVCGEDKIVIVLKLDRGEIYTFGDTQISGACLFPMEVIQRQVVFAEDDPYSPEKIRETIKNITDLYGRRGYIDASVDVEPSLSCDELVYSIKITIEEGEQYRVGMIKVFGNCSTQTRVILHETLLIPGDVFNSEKLNKTEERLKNIGYFKNVNVYAVKSDGALGLGNAYRDVHIEVEETSTGNFGAFLGFSTVESVFGGLNVTERNFNIAGLSQVWDEGYAVMRGGGEYLHLTTTIGAKSRKYQLSWTKPYFMDTPWAIGFDVERANNRYISDNYDINTWGLTLHGTYPLNPFLKFGTHYRLKHSSMELGSSVYCKEVVSDPLHNQKECGTCRRKAEIESSHHCGMISAAGVSLLYDSTDNPSNPRNGFKSRLELEFAGIGGDHKFVGTAYLNTYFYPVYEKGVIKYRFDMRFIQPFDPTEIRHMPLDELLFLGGDNNVRGYRAYRIGPYFPCSKDPSGGLSLQLYSVEYAHRFHSRVEGFLFFDAGHLSANTWEFAVPRASIGLGLRLKVLDSIPPVTIGMGQPLNAHNRSEEKRFFMNVGGRF